VLRHNQSPEHPKTLDHKKHKQDHKEHKD
jgi:hypothetical protein